MQSWGGPLQTLPLQPQPPPTAAAQRCRTCPAGPPLRDAAALLSSTAVPVSATLLCSPLLPAATLPRTALLHLLVRPLPYLPLCCTVLCGILHPLQAAHHRGVGCGAPRARASRGCSDDCREDTRGWGRAGRRGRGQRTCRGTALSSSPCCQQAPSSCIDRGNTQAWGGRAGANSLVLAAAATRGQRSAHSLATGPVMAEPFISPCRGRGGGGGREGTSQRGGMRSACPSLRLQPPEATTHSMHP